MKVRLAMRWLLLTIPFLFSLVGCSLPFAGLSPGGNIETQVAGTMIAIRVAETLNAQGAVPEPNQAVVATDSVESGPPTPTASPTITLTPTNTLTPTLEVPMVSVSRSTYCRTGPGEDYEEVGVLMEGEEAEVVGLSSDGGTWIIKNPDGEGECWLWGYYATVTGPTDNLTVYTPPATTTPEFDWGGTWFVSLGDPLSGMFVEGTMNATVSGNAFTATIEGEGSTVTFNGTISEDYMTVSGTWEEAGFTGSIRFYALGVNQFQGNYHDGPDAIALCGARAGAGFPDPCFMP